MPGIADMARSLLAADPVDRAMFPTEANGTINWVGRNSVLSRLLNSAEATNAVIRETRSPSRRPGSLVAAGPANARNAPWAGRPLSRAAGQQVQNRSAFLGNEAQRISAEAAARRNGPVAPAQAPFAGASAGAGSRAGAAGSPIDTPEAQARRAMLGTGMQSDASSINRAMQELEGFRGRRGLLVQS